MRTSADTWSGTIVLGSGIAVYVGPGATAAAHRHDAIQLIWSPERPVLVGTASGSTTAHAAIVASRESHHVESDGAPIGIVLVEPSGRLGQCLDALVRQSPNLIDRQPTDTAIPIAADATTVVAWARSLIASFVGDGADLTTAAARAGFADSAHFSRTFRETFGLTPSEILPLLTVSEADSADR